MRKRLAIVQLAEHALRLAQIGDFEGAAASFEQAIALDAHNLDLKFNLAIVEEQLGHITNAAALLIYVLQRKPANAFSAASRLSRLLSCYRVDDSAVLTPAGLCTALRSRDVALQPIADAGFQWFAREDSDWKSAIRSIVSGQASEIEAGRTLIARLRRTDRTKLELLQLCLSKGIVKDADAELLLTGVRAAILRDRDGAIFNDRETFGLALALMVQGWNNDHAWAETPEERSALLDIEVDRARLLTGDLEATQAFICASLYRPLEEIVSPPFGVGHMRELKPKAFRETLGAQIEERAGREAAARALRSIGALSDATSLKVARQYEKAPYPRWQTFQRPAPGALKRFLSRLLPSRDLSFVEDGCDVLIAGCGTGQQALMVATGHGPKAKVLAIDLSRASLAYASIMAEREKISNVSFLQADIHDAVLLNRQFDVIYCVGVLHHMADWRMGWRTLLTCLKPSGLMNIGLYSAVARRGIRDLRSEFGYPGAGCSDEAARGYRRSLLLREDGTPGSYPKLSRDFYSLNTFRDLVLHESEAQVTIDEIAEFLEANGLVFRGFGVSDGVHREFADKFPQGGESGRLADWAAFEKLKPHTFDGMYDFWVSREDAPPLA